jgi:tricarballylate dehydrogenase
MSPLKDKYDVVVVGAGNAALSSAIAAKLDGANVLVLEKAPEAARGGNSYVTGGAVRFPYDDLDDLIPLLGEISDAERAQIDVGTYPRSAFYDDLMRVTGGKSDPELADVLVNNAHDTAVWLREQGVRWGLMYSRQSFKVDGVYKFWGGLACETVGAGKGLVDSLFDRAVALGIDIAYGTMGDHLLIDQQGGIRGIALRGPDGLTEVETTSVVLACGGFEANAEMRTRYLGPGWDMAKVRGTRYNTGDGIRMALEIGARSHGHYSGCHAVAWDAGAPDEGGDRTIADLYQKHSYPLGLIVNVEGKRFVDEGADFRNYTYAKYGKEILNQPNRLAFQVFDSQVTDMLRDEYHIRETTKFEANTIRELAIGLDMNADALEKTVSDYNAAVQDTHYNPAILDGKTTIGITPEKTNWALRLDKPPYTGYAVTCGITFTFGGLKIDTTGRVIDTQDKPIPGLYAAGELVGGIFYENYPGGSGITNGFVFGKIAGTGAAAHASA